MGVFSDPEPFLFALTKIKVRAVGSFPPTKSVQLANQTGQNHCGIPSIYVANVMYTFLVFAMAKMRIFISLEEKKWFLS